MKVGWVCLVLLGCANVHPSSVMDTDPILTTLLKSMGLMQADLSIQGDILDDPDRPRIVRQLLSHPLDYGTVTQHLGGNTPALLLQSVVPLSGIVISEITRDSLSEHVSSDMPLVLQKLFAELVWCKRDVDIVCSSFTAEELKQLENLFQLVHPEAGLAEADADVLIALGRRVDRAVLCRAMVRLLQAVDVFLAEHEVLAPVQIETAIGRVVVGSSGDDVYDRPAVLIIDPGGNDRYEGVAGVAKRGVSVCIDLGGDDVYAVQQAVGNLGIGALIDLSGNDHYLCTSLGQGVGIAGVGVIDDGQGDDVYQGDIGCQGVGVYGVGLLMDRGGEDQYKGAFLTQGAAGPGGVGILGDVLGNDLYESGGRVRDFREDGYFQCMAQGFSLGVRPLTSGGVGVLVDGAGDDVYRAEYFAQGAAFWGGAGFLIDRQGSDRYEARRYAQGSGVHLAVGILHDQAGHDRYAVWGVGQGCGHDLAVGILCDVRGNDVYRASWLAQGAGNANGIGMLDDVDGDDHYVAERNDAQGYGTPSRTYGSMGLLIDRAGRDLYEGSGGDGQVWKGGFYGGGIDWPMTEKGAVRAPKR